MKLKKKKVKEKRKILSIERVNAAHSLTEWILYVGIGNKRKENSIVIFQIGLHRSCLVRAIFSTEWVYFGIKQFSRILFVQVERQRKRANNGSSVDGYEDRNRGSNTGVALERSWGWPGNSTYFSLFGLSGWGWEARRGKRIVERGQGEEKDRGIEEETSERGRRMGKPRSRKHFST